MNLKTSVVISTGSSNLAERIRKRVAEILEAGADAAEDGMVKRLTTGPKTGRVYKSRRGKGHKPKRGWSKNADAAPEGGAMHQASAPGESPAEDTGDLRRAIKKDKSKTRRKIDPEAAVVIKGDKAVVAITLENGSVDGKTGARPWIRPSGKDAVKAMREEARRG